MFSVVHLRRKRLHRLDRELERPGSPRFRMVNKSKDVCTMCVKCVHTSVHKEHPLRSIPTKYTSIIIV